MGLWCWHVAMQHRPIRAKLDNCRRFHQFRSMFTATATKHTYRNDNGRTGRQCGPWNNGMVKTRHKPVDFTSSYP